jgi:hypothetical protein
MTRIGKEYLASITGEAASAQDLHVINVYNDPEFQKEVKAAEGDEELKDIAARYVIPIDDIRHYLNGFEQTNLVHKATSHFDIQPDSKGNWRAWISNDITKDDFDKLWAEINRIKKRKYGNKVPQPKPPKHDKLLYAIFKQRQLQPPTTFAKIHSLYLDDKLPYYKHDNDDEKWIYDAKKFEEYYDKYKPTPVPPT